jgi:hypothetical protein
MTSTGGLRDITDNVGGNFEFQTAFLPNVEQFGCCTGGAGLERITINLEDPQVVFDDIANTLTEEAQPILEAIAALG